MKTKLYLIGGFLGAGKTTFLDTLSKKMTKDQQKIRLITNDQASELVDTFYLQQNGGKVSEVSGSCFCCNFNGFVNAALDFRTADQADVILAEPVGSCTDLSATLMQPIKDKYADAFDIAPLTVLADPNQLKALLGKKGMGIHKSAAYIYQKQLEEADIIAITKADLLTQAESQSLTALTAQHFPRAKVVAISSLTDVGLDEWMTLASQRSEVGATIAPVDYDTYAEGEAAFGWLNATVSLAGEHVDWNAFMGSFANTLADGFMAKKVPIGHLKFLLQAGNGYVIANLVGGSKDVSLRHEVPSGNAALLTINARVEMPPDQLQQMMESELQKACGNSIAVTAKTTNVLTPGRPNPTYRYSSVV